MLFHETLADGQPEAGALPNLFRREERVHHPAEMLRCDARPRVRHDHVDPLLGDGDWATRRLGDWERRLP